MNALRIGRVLLAVMLMAGGAAYADDPAPGGNMMYGPMMNMMMGRQGMMGPGMMGSGAVCRTMGPGMMGGSMMGRGMMGMGMGRMMRLPDLTDAQRQTITQRHRQLQKQMLDLEKQALDARFALEDAMAKDMPDPKAVGRAMQGVFDVRRQMAEAAIAAHNDVLNALTDEQRQALRSHSRMGMGASGMRRGMTHGQPSQ